MVRTGRLRVEATTREAGCKSVVRSGPERATKGKKKKELATDPAGHGFDAALGERLAHACPGRWAAVAICHTFETLPYPQSRGRAADVLSAACAPVARMQTLSCLRNGAQREQKHVCMVARREAAVRALVTCGATPALSAMDLSVWNLLLWAPRDATPEILWFSFGMRVAACVAFSFFLSFFLSQPNH